MLSNEGERRCGEGGGGWERVGRKERIRKGTKMRGRSNEGGKEVGREEGAVVWSGSSLGGRAAGQAEIRHSC